jgi:uncharacterized protein (TIGR03435 family)
VRFNVSAKLPDACTPEQVPEMLQALLSDRFALKVHRASKDLQVYALVVRGGGLKIMKSPREQPDEQRANIPQQVKLAGGGGRGGIVDYGGGSYFALPPIAWRAGNYRWRPSPLSSVVSRTAQ